jgi:hypothetical protein
LAVQIQVNTDTNIDATDELVRTIDAELDSALSRFGDHITRVEVHIGDENAGKSDGVDKRCVLEARPAGQPPVVVTHHAGSVAEACSGAVQKLEKLLESKYGKSDQRKGSESIRHMEVREGLI